MVEARKANIVVGIFHDRTQAEQAVDELNREGYAAHDIGIAARGDEGVPEETITPTGEAETGEAASAGAAGGGIAGGILGAAVSGIIPGVGPVIAVGALTGILGGVVLGGAAGGIGGALVGMGVSEKEAEVYEEEFRAGRTIVTVEVDDGTEEAVRAVMTRHGAYDAHNRAP
jgi:hypothetical protein